MKQLKKGFTLIELLVVISIIVILAAIFFVNVSQARLKARDSAIIAALSQIRTEKELTFNGQYQAASLQIRTTIENNGGKLNEALTGTEYRSSSILPGGGAYCVDSTGSSRKVDNEPTSASCQ